MIDPALIPHDADTKDEARWLVLADHIAELGFPIMATIAREGGEMPDFASSYGFGFSQCLEAEGASGLLAYGWPPNLDADRPHGGTLFLLTNGGHTSRWFHSHDPDMLRQFAEETHRYATENDIKSGIMMSPREWNLPRPISTADWVPQ